MNQSFFLPTFFHSALAILEPQIYIVVEQFRAENITLLSGRLVIGNMNIQKHKTLQSTQLKRKTKRKPSRKGKLIRNITSISQGLNNVVNQLLPLELDLHYDEKHCQYVDKDQACS